VPARLKEALELARALGVDRAIPRLLGWSIVESIHRGATNDWRTFAADLEASRRTEDPGHLSFAIHALGFMAHDAGYHQAAAAYLEEAIAICKRVGDPAGTAQALASLAVVAQAQGHRARAAGLGREALQLAHDLSNPRSIAWCVQAAVRLSAAEIPAERLARLLGAADALKATAGLQVSPRQQEQFDQLVTSVRAALGDEAFGEAWAAGRLVPPQEVISDTLALLESAAAGSRDQSLTPGPRPCGLLSPREQQVLALVAEGLTDKEIAERLVISSGTVMFHLKSLRRKLGARSRTEAVAIAAKRGLL
jgi:non-specific serine/threonine protein kinase